MLLSLTPGAVLALAVARDHVQALAGAARLAGPPHGLRAEVLRLASSTGSHAVAFRAAMGRSTRSFGMNGFPKPLDHGHLGLAHLSHLSLSVAGAAAVAATATATAVVTAVGPFAHHGAAASHLTAGVARAPAVGAAASARPAATRTRAGGQHLAASAGSTIGRRPLGAPFHGGAGAPGSPPWRSAHCWAGR